MTENTGSTHADPDTIDPEEAVDEVPSTEAGVRDVLIVGGGVAGLMASVFTARAGFNTVVVNDGESILRRNAHLENVPGFPAGVNPRLFADMLEAQATRNGADLRSGRVTSIARREPDHDDSETFVATLDGESADESSDDETEHGNETERDSPCGNDEIEARYVIAASWSDASYLDDLGVDIRNAGSKRYVEDDGLGRTNVDGLYVAGRLAERYHQTVVAAGNGAQVAITLIHDSDVPFYHDWVVPEGYFTDRGREVPPGCEEIDANERSARERESMATMQEYFGEPHAARQRTHPSLVDDELGRISEDD